METRNASLALFIVLAAVGFAQSAQPQDWPQKPVRIIVPFAAGGNSDVVARIIAQDLGEAFGQQFVVENRPAASGAVAAEAVARAAPDGHTLFMATPGQIAILPAMTKAPYDPVKDFAPISNIGATPYVLAVHPSVPVSTLAEFVGYVRGHPNQVTFASSGTSSGGHLSMVLFLKRAGLDMIPVVYKGGTAPVTDVIAGHVKTYFGNLTAVVPHATSGALRLMAVTSERRIPQYPDVPTLNESGFPSFNILSWTGLMAPAGTPKTIVERIAKEVVRAVNDPKIADRLARNGIDPLTKGPEEFAAMIAADVTLWAEAVKIAGGHEK